MGIQQATQAALTPDKKVKLIKKKLTPSEAICHNDVEAEVDQTNKVAARRKKSAEAVDKMNHLEYPRTRFRAGGSLGELTSFNSFSTAYCAKGCRGRR